MCTLSLLGWRAEKGIWDLGFGIWVWMDGLGWGMEDEGINGDRGGGDDERLEMGDWRWEMEMGDWYHGHLIWHCPRSGALYGAKICSVTPSRCLCGTRTAPARVQTSHLGVWHRDYPEVKTTSSAAHTHSVLRTVRPVPSLPRRLPYARRSLPWAAPGAANTTTTTTTTGGARMRAASRPKPSSAM